MGTTNYIAVSVEAPTGVEMPSDLRMIAAWNAHVGNDGFYLNGYEISLPGWDGDDFEERREDETIAKRSMTFRTGGFEYGSLCRAAKRFTARFPGVTVTTWIENSDESGIEEDKFRNGKHILTGEGGPMRPLLTTRELVERILSEWLVVGDLPDPSWMDDLARRIDDGEVTK